jgi:MFS family permease
MSDGLCESDEVANKLSCLTASFVASNIRAARIERTPGAGRPVLPWASGNPCMSTAHVASEPMQPRGAHAALAVKYANPASLHRYMALYALAILSITAIWGGVGHLLLALHIQQIEFARFFNGMLASVNLQELNTLKAQVDAGAAIATAEQQRLLQLLARFETAKAASLSLATSVGVFVTMLCQPIVGLLSDRTRSRWGRRSPWIVGGALVSGAGLIALCYSPTVGALVALWALVGVATNAASGPLAATVPDRVPEDKIGLVSAINGLGFILGLVLGMLVAGALFNRIGLNSYLPFAVMVVVACCMFALGARDQATTELRLAPVGVVAHLKSFTFALRDSDYRWVWIAKVVIMFGFSVAGTYNVYMLQSYIQPGLSPAEAARTAPLLQLAALPGTLIAMVIAGRWSDRIRRRKPFVIGASLLLATSMLVPLAWPSLVALYLQAIVGGIAVGAFVVVDQALFIDVLPDKLAVGRDLGIGNLAGNFGQAIGPGVAGVVLAITGGYRMIWLAAFMLVIVAAIAVIPVKRAK